MKIFLRALVFVGAFSCVSSYGMQNAYQGLRQHIVGLGESIENYSNLPVVDRLTNVLPFALLAAGLKKCPIQTVLVLTAVASYYLSRNDYIYEKMADYGLLNRSKKNKPQHNNIIDDETLFVFDGEDELDAEYQLDIENDLLFGEEEESDNPFKNQHEQSVNAANNKRLL